jgi:hypothetical protein
MTVMHAPITERFGYSLEDEAEMEVQADEAAEETIVNPDELEKVLDQTFLAYPLSRIFNNLEPAIGEIASGKPGDSVDGLIQACLLLKKRTKDYVNDDDFRYRIREEFQVP